LTLIQMTVKILKNPCKRRRKMLYWEKPQQTIPCCKGRVIMKRLLILLLTLALAFAFFGCKEDISESTPEPSESLHLSASSAATDESIEGSEVSTSESSIGNDSSETVRLEAPDNDKVLYGKNMHSPCHPASTTKVVTAKYSAEDLVSERTNLAYEIETELSEKLELYNVEVVSTSIEDMDFTDAFTNAVEEKQVAQQNKLRAETEAETLKIEAEAAAEVKRIEAQAQADAKLIEAEAEAEANRKVAESITDNILYNKFIDSWNGELPMVSGSDGNLINIPIGGNEE